ncbi:MAG: response regulator [Deltaproteobacteria bacterium]|nr:response regulator [Deltaproteobacteria bacterium]
MNQLQEMMGTAPQVHPYILLMEDEVNLAKGLQMVLREDGYSVDWAMTGRSALDKFDERYYDLLVADLRLPDIDGMEVIKQVKAKRPETEAIVITGYPSVSSAVESSKIGVSDYLRKPFTDEEFKAAVDGALKKKETPTVDKFLTETKEGKLIQKREVLRVLDRTYEEPAFWRELIEQGSKALEDYNLSNEAKAAIISGDLQWINEYVGELTQKQLVFILKRLEREAW